MTNREVHQQLLDELNRRYEKVKLGGGLKNIEKHKAKGKLTARERIDCLVDVPNDFVEVGAFVGEGMYPEEGGCPSGGVVIGIGKVSGPNGLHVILHEDHGPPIVAVSVMYHVGSKNETRDRRGFAHFFGHLLFEGSANIQRGEFSKLVENAGGVLNANTNGDRTYYYEVLPSNQLELGLWLESERMLHAKVDQLGVDTQREVVKEERRQRYENQPYGTLTMEVLKRAFTQHPYQWPTIGYLEDLNAASEADYQALYKKFYVPNNATLVVAGDFTPDKARALVERYFGDIPRGEAVEQPSVVEPPLGGE